MKIRFRETWPSSNPDFPFQAGQVISIDSPTPDMQRAIRLGMAVIIREDEPEMAVVSSGEQAVTQPPKKRQREWNKPRDPR